MVLSGVRSLSFFFFPFLLPFFPFFLFLLIFPFFPLSLSTAWILKLRKLVLNILSYSFQ